MDAKDLKRDLDDRPEPSRAELVRGVNHLLTIAVDEYHHQRPLCNCVKDAGEISGVLLKNYAFEAENVKKLWNGDATRKNILVVLHDYARDLGENDSLVVLFSGHGHSENDVGSWVPVEAESFPDYLGVSTVRDYLEPIKARHIFVIADACFAGAFFPRTRADVAATAKHQERFPSRYALTSGRDEPVSDGPRGENSPFAEALKYQLGESAGSVGSVTLSEQTTQLVCARTEGFQTPRHGELNIRGNRSGQFFFHKKRSLESDPFVENYFKNGKSMFPPWNLKHMQERFEEYDRDFEAQPEERKVELRRLNTKLYLARWGLSVSILKKKLKQLRVYSGEEGDEYTEELARAIADFQRDHWMRYQDGYFGELTYQQMVTALIMEGLAQNPSR